MGIGGSAPCTRSPLCPTLSLRPGPRPAAGDSEARVGATLAEADEPEAKNRDVALDITGKLGELALQHRGSSGPRASLGAAAFSCCVALT